MPTVLITNWTWSARVMDHMPPMVEYTSTMAPPTAMARARSQPNSTTKMVA